MEDSLLNDNANVALRPASTNPSKKVSSIKFSKVKNNIFKKYKKSTFKITVFFVTGKDKDEVEYDESGSLLHDVKKMTVLRKIFYAVGGM